MTSKSPLRKKPTRFDGIDRESLFRLDYSLDDLGVATNQAISYMEPKLPLYPEGPFLEKGRYSKVMHLRALDIYRDALEDFNSRTDVLNQTRALIKGFAVLFNFFDVRKNIAEAGLQQITDFLQECPTMKIWLKQAKYLLTYPLAAFLKNVPPPPFTDGGKTFPFVPKGLFRKWMKAHLNAFNAKNIKLWYSWYNLKRCALAPPMNVLADAYRSHAESLTRPDPADTTPNGKVLEEIMGSKVALSFLETIAREFSDQIQLDRKTGKVGNYRPSPNAALAYSRARGGQHKGVRDYIKEQTGGGLVLRSPEFYSMALVPHAIVKNKKTHNYVISQYRTVFDRWDDLVLFLHNDYHDEDAKSPECEIYAIPEPLKVRIISKGPAEEYFAAKPLQKALHSVLRKKTAFKLIGEKFRTDHLGALRPEKLKSSSLSEQLQWLSVDYSSATDYLSAEFSRRVVDHITKYLPEADKAVIRRTLVMHEMLYKYDTDVIAVKPLGKKGPTVDHDIVEKEYSVMQTNGQLMGSPMSFPLLCICNYLLYLHVTTDLHKAVGLSRRERYDSVLVNGDDMLYVGRQSDFDFHINCGGSIGLTMSPGKAYVNRDYLNINSTSVLCKVLGGGNGKIIPFFNIGLLFGIHKTGAVDDPFSREDDVNRSKRLGKSRIESSDSGSSISFRTENDLATTRTAVLAEAIYRDSRGILSPNDPEGKNCLALAKMMKQYGFENNRSIPPMSRKNIVALLNRRDNFTMKNPNYVSIINEVLSSAGSMAPEALHFMMKWSYSKRMINYDTTCLVKRHDGKIWELHHRNLFLPESVGGMGVKKPKGFKTTILPVDRQIAAYVLERGGGLIDTCRPFRFPQNYEKTEPIENVLNAPWDPPIVPDGKMTTFNLKTELRIPKRDSHLYLELGCVVTSGRYRKVLDSKKRVTRRYIELLRGDDPIAEFD